MASPLATRLAALNAIDLAYLLNGYFESIEHSEHWAPQLAEYQVGCWENALQAAMDRLAALKLAADDRSLAELRRAFRSRNRGRQLALGGFHQAVQSASGHVQRQWEWAPRAYAKALVDFVGVCEAQRRVSGLTNQEAARGGVSLVLSRAETVYAAALESPLPAIREMVSERIADLRDLQTAERKQVESLAEQIARAEAALKSAKKRARDIATSHPLMASRLEALHRLEREVEGSTFAKQAQADVAIARTRLGDIDNAVAALRKLRDPDPSGAHETDTT